jgi:hypothetical protein
MVERVQTGFQPGQVSPPPLIVNQFLRANATGLVDEAGQLSDWLEVYNQADHPVDLASWALTDDPNRPTKWPFPEIRLPAKDFLLIFASGKDHRSVVPGMPLHTNFKLDHSGKFLGLYNIESGRFEEIKTASFPGSFSNLSCRHAPQQHYGDRVVNPSPGKTAPEQPGSWKGSVDPVTFSVERGFYDHPFLVTLKTITNGATIRYTTDGTLPTAANGLTYDQPLAITGTTLLRAVAFHPDCVPAPAVTHSYIFLEQVLRQPASPAGFPPTWGRHEIDFAGYRAGSPVVADYEMDPELVNDPTYRSTLKAGLKAIPTLSLVTDIESFSIYANPRKRGQAWERPVSVELIDPAGRQPGFQIPAGLRIQGGAGRWEFMPKHSFRLFFRGDYGASRLNYPLFPDSPVDSFDTLVLRAGSDRSYAGHPESTDHALTTYTRDEWLRTSQIEMSGVGAHGLFVHLYLNGLYWGLYNVVERPDAAFAAAYFGQPEPAWYVLNHRGGLSGSRDRFQALLDLVERDQLTQPHNYALAQDYLDVPHFIDYLILNWYAGTKDWPENNWYAAILNPDGKLMFFVWDGEESWQNGAEIHTGAVHLAGQPNQIKLLFEALIKNPEFKLALADRMYKHLFNDGALTDTASQRRWIEINREIEAAIIGESLRWGDARQEPPITPADWGQARNQVLAQMDGNAATLLAQARALGYFPGVTPPEFNQSGGRVAAGFNLSMTTDADPIYYTIDGSDPRVPYSGVIAPQAILYQTPLLLTTTTHLKARRWSKGRWSALHQATFTIKDSSSQLRITEIMYNPLEGNQLEYLLLTNTGSTGIDLAGASFRGIEFEFGPTTPPLKPRETLCLVRNRIAFAEKYPDQSIAGTYQGQLANEGETIRLIGPDGQELAAVTYDDGAGWPLSADGRGDALILIGPAGEPDDPKHWRGGSTLRPSPTYTGKPSP